jgi:cytochrome c-type biogenesis protein CcmH
MPFKRWLFLFGLLALLCTPHRAAAGAQNVAADPALEARVNALSAELRCLVCQNQTIADSHADLAVDLKNQVRDQLKAGRSEKDVIDYMTTRYGDFVLYRPPFKATTPCCGAARHCWCWWVPACSGAACVPARRRRPLPA